MRAEALSRKEVGAVAFSRTGVILPRAISDAKVIRKFGDVPDGLSAERAVKIDYRDTQAPWLCESVPLPAMFAHRPPPMSISTTVAPKIEFIVDPPCRTLKSHPHTSFRPPATKPDYSLPPVLHSTGQALVVHFGMRLAFAGAFGGAMEFFCAGLRFEVPAEVFVAAPGCWVTPPRRMPGPAGPV
jgi:hypothetical protein